MEDLLDLYAEPYDPARPVICFDESPKQLIGVMAKMDLAGALDAEHVAQGEVTTVAVNAFQFAAPIQVGDVLSLYVRRLRTGEKSITSKVSVFAERQTGECVEITEAVMTFVAIDGLGRSRNIHAAH